jgi:hypothetical protein
MTNPIDQLSDDEWLQLVRRAVSMPNAPAELLQSALALWRQGGPAATSALPPRRWLAVLSFDSWATAPVLAGMRALRSEVRQLLYTAQDIDIDLRIAPKADHFTLSGQLLGSDADAGIELAVLAGPDEKEPLRVTRLDELGEFVLDGVPGGTYMLTVRVGADEVVLAPIEIGAPPAACGV